MSSEDRVHLHVYGIRSCDSCRYALRWLDTRRVPHTFHDVRQEGLDAKQVDSWLASAHANVDETHAGKRNHALHSVIPW